MKRQNLLWFAAGAGVSAAASLAAVALIPSGNEVRWSLRVFETTASGFADESEVKWASGEIGRACEAIGMQFSAGLIPDSQDSTMVPLTPENASAAPCFLHRTLEAGMPVSLQVEIGKNAQTH